MILQMKYFPYTDRSVTNDFIFTIKLSHAWDYVMYYKLYACMCVYVHRTSRSSSWLVRLNLTLRTIQLNVWVAGNFTTLDILFLSIILQCYKSNRFKNHTAILCTTKLFAKQNTFCIIMHGWLITLHLLICVFYAL